MVAKTPLVRTPLVSRAGNTAWQALISSATVAQVSSTLAGGGVSIDKKALPVLLGAVVSVVVTLMRTTAFTPTAEGLLGLSDRVVATFLAGGAGAAALLIPLRKDVVGSISGGRSVAMVALGGAIAAILSYTQHAGNVNPHPGPIPSQGAYSTVDPEASKPAPYVFLDQSGDVVRKTATLSDFVRAIPQIPSEVWKLQLRGNKVSAWMASQVNNAGIAAVVETLEKSDMSAEASKAQLTTLLRTAYRF